MYHKLKVTNSRGQLLKQYHHVTLNADFLQDCRVWTQFLKAEDVHICHPFIDFSNPEGEILNFASRAAKSGKLGMGVVFGNNWICMSWGQSFITDMDPSIEFLELYALTMALMTWSQVDRKLLNNRIVIFCDNQGVIQMVNNYATSCYQCHKLIHIIALCGIRYNLRVIVKFVRSQENVLPDALLRLDFKRFWRSAPYSMNPCPDQLDNRLLPIEKLWSHDINYLNLF